MFVQEHCQSKKIDIGRRDRRKEVASELISDEKRD
jgi:hypothetical protein